MLEFIHVGKAGCFDGIQGFCAQKFVEVGLGVELGGADEAAGVQGLEKNADIFPRVLKAQVKLLTEHLHLYCRGLLADLE